MEGTTDIHSDPDVPENAVRYETRYVDIAPLFSEPICKGTLDMVDFHVKYVADAMGIDLESRPQRLWMFLAQSGTGVPDVWCMATSNCYSPIADASFTYLHAAPHELVHAITIGARGSSFWNENIAEAYMGRYTIYEPLWRGGPEWPPAFHRNGHFARWLIDWRDGPSFMDLFDETVHGSQTAVEAAFRAVYGANLPEVLDEYAASTPLVYPDHLQCYVPQGTTEVAWNGDWWELEVGLDCTQPNTFTSDEAISRMSARIPLSISRPGKYRFVADNPDAEIAIQICIDEPWFESFDPSKWPKISDPILGAPTLPAGRYLLEISVPLGDPITVRLQGYPSIENQEIP